MVAAASYPEGHARAVLAVPDHEARKRLAKRIVREGCPCGRREGRAGWRSRPEAKGRHEGRSCAAERLVRGGAAHRPARAVSAGKLEIHFGAEVPLEELVEVLESL